jgi:Tfp pilus assembly protein PilV
MNSINTRREAGMVSILVTMVMMIVITLIVLGFAEISRTEQRNSADNQLSTQAYYAAESGINDARASINSLLATNPATTIRDKTNCQNDSNYPSLTFGTSYANQVNSSANVSYTCLLITANPTSLYYNVGTISTVIPISATNPVARINLNWGIGNGFSGAGTCNATAGQFPASGSWTCNFPVLRVDIVSANSTFSRTNWPTTTDTIFFVPTTAGSLSTNKAAFSPPGGGVYAASCALAASPPSCTGVITGLSGANYFMRVTTLYQADSPLVVSTSSNQPLYDAQAIIDATGKAQDVLRRVVVAADLTDANAYPIPSGALITENSVCKQFGVTKGYFNVGNSGISGGGGDQLCTQALNNGTPLP